jgi:CRP/FNR family transcriptional regulator
MPHLAFQPTQQARPAGGFEQVLAQASLRRVEAKEFVFAEGDPATHLFRVETGAIALYKVSADGRRQIVGFAYPGDMIGLGSQGEHVMNAQAVKPSRLRCVPIGVLHHSASEDPALGFKLYEALARELAATRDLMLTTGQRSAMERVASFLLAFSRRGARNGDDPLDFELPMTRGDIGDFLGLTIETVSRCFSKLKAINLIELASSNRVRLVNINKLKSIADGETNVRTGKGHANHARHAARDDWARAPLCYSRPSVPKVADRRYAETEAGSLSWRTAP